MNLQRPRYEFSFAEVCRAAASARAARYVGDGMCVYNAVAQSGAQDVLFEHAVPLIGDEVFDDLLTRREVMDTFGCLSDTPIIVRIPLCEHCGRECGVNGAKVDGEQLCLDCQREVQHRLERIGFGQAAGAGWLVSGRTER